MAVLRVSFMPSGIEAPPRHSVICRWAEIRANAGETILLTGGAVREFDNESRVSAGCVTGHGVRSHEAFK